jgi:hypothetical protein
MHRSISPLLVMCVAGSFAFAVRARANPEAELLARFQRENGAGRDKLEAALTLAVKEAGELIKTDPIKAARVLREVHHGIQHATGLGREERRRLLLALQPHIHEAVLQSLVHLPRTRADVLAEYKDHEAAEGINDGIPRPKLLEVYGTLLFSNGVQCDAVVHGVGARQVRCTLHGHRLAIPGWQVPALRIMQGYYFFDYALGTFVYATPERHAAADKLWHAQAQPQNRNGFSVWDLLAQRMALHGGELTGLVRQGRPGHEIAGCVNRQLPELAWCCRDQRLDEEIEEHLHRSDVKDRQAVRGLIAAYADRAGKWQFSKQQTLSVLTPQLRAAVPNLTPMQEDRLAEFILNKAEHEMQQRPL